MWTKALFVLYGNVALGIGWGQKMKSFYRSRSQSSKPPYCNPVLLIHTRWLAMGHSVLAMKYLLALFWFSGEEQMISCAKIVLGTGEEALSAAFC